MEQTECSETSAYKIQTPGNYPEESVQRSEHDKKFEIKDICGMFHVRGNCLTILYGQIA
jgi:hypothetical protein